MAEFAIAIGSALLAISVYHFALGALFSRLLLRAKPSNATNDELPKTAILLPLRGADPGLGETLQRLMQQNHPDYEIHIVIDSELDPAWNTVNDVVERLQARHVHVSTLAKRSQTCSPQCSALIQAVEGLDDLVEAVAIIDGDVVVHENWLRDLTTPLLDPRVGIAHGNRWFMPRDHQWGSLARYLWNAAAVLPMCLLGIPWAGTFVIRKQVLFESGLFRTWPRTIVPDAPAKSLLKKFKLRVHFVPSLMMVNRERCDLGFCLDFIKRQMMWTRIYHPNWWPVILHALATTAILAIALGISAYGLISGNYESVVWAGGGLLVYLTCLLFLLSIMEVCVRRVVRSRGESTAWLSLTKFLKLSLSLPLTQAVHLIAVLLAHFKRRVVWRGVTYHVRGPLDVHVSDDQPFQQSALPADTNVSL